MSCPLQWPNSMNINIAYIVPTSDMLDSNVNGLLDSKPSPLGQLLLETPKECLRAKDQTTWQPQGDCGRPPPLGRGAIGQIGGPIWGWSQLHRTALT